MLALIIFILVGILFIWLIIYSSVMPKIMKKHGRQVDARVVSCETGILSVTGTERKGTYYLVKVEFYGLNGETIVKTVNREMPYTVGDVVRSCYVDKKDFLLFDEEKPIVKEPSGKAVTILALIVMLLIGISAVGMIITENEELQELFSYGIGYGVSILFTGYGIYEIIKSKKRSQLKSELQVIMGTQVSYERERNTHGSGYFYYFIYEYTLNGERCLYRSTVGKSGTSKKMGRQVHIERNILTGEVSCREDEKSAFVLYCILALVGMLILGFMIIYTI